MALTWKTVAEVAPTDAEVSLVVYTDTSDTTFTWTSEPPANATTGITLPAQTMLLPGTKISINTINVPLAMIGEVEIKVKGNVSPISPPISMAFIPYSREVDGIRRHPTIEMVADELIVAPGDISDSDHSPLYTFVLKTYDGAVVPNAEVRWSFDPPVEGFVYDGATSAKIVPVQGESIWYPSKTNAQGQAQVRVTAEQIVELTVQAETLGVDEFRDASAYYITIDPNSPYYQDVTLLGPGPYTDNPVDLDGTTHFYVIVPKNLAMPPSADTSGFLYLQGSVNSMAWAEDSLSDIIYAGPIPVSDAVLDQNNPNNLTLFAQDSSGNVYGYYTWQFTTTGEYINEPDPTIKGRKGSPPVPDPFVAVGGVINIAYVTSNKGIPLSCTPTLDKPEYFDGTWGIYFEWFLNGEDRSNMRVSTVPSTITQGQTTYMDILPLRYCSGYTGPGQFYCDYYIGKLGEDISTTRVYSNYVSTPYVLST